MFIKRIVPTLALFTLWACGDKVPQKTNVLNRAGSQHTKSGSKSSNRMPEQTVFKKPEQITSNKKNDGEREQTNVETEKSNITYSPPATFNAFPEMAPGSRGYYLHRTDSLQRVYAVSDYNKNIQTIINQITEIPGRKKDATHTSENWYAGIDFNIRKPNFVVLHHTGQSSAEQTLFTFSLRRPGRESSAHYVIGRDGTVFHLINDFVRSWHAGNSKWGNINDMNSCSIGIEIDNNGVNEEYSDNQISALLKLLSKLKSDYNIPQSNFVAHADIAPGRKGDPSKYFPWKKLAAAGFGFWYDANNLPTPPADFNAILALRVIGYDVKNQANAIGAFKLHYIQNDLSKQLTDYDKKVLYAVYKNY